MWFLVARGTPTSTLFRLMTDGEEVLQICHCLINLSDISRCKPFLSKKVSVTQVLTLTERVDTNLLDLPTPSRLSFSDSISGGHLASVLGPSTLTTPTPTLSGNPIGFWGGL